MKRLVILGLCAITVFIGLFFYWITATEPYAQMIVAPSLTKHPHILVGFTLGFPSKTFSRFVRLQNAWYTDAGVRFKQEKAWVYEDLLWAGTAADEDILTGLVPIEGYAPKGDKVSLLFKLRDDAYVSELDSPLQLSSGPYTVIIHYKALWFSRICTFTYGEPAKYTLLPLDTSSSS